MGSPGVTDTDIPGDEVPRHIRSADDLMCHVNDVWHSCSRLANQNVELQLRLELAEVTRERDRRKEKMATLHADEFPGKIVLWRKLMRLQAELDETKSRCGDVERRKNFLELNVDDLERMVTKLQYDLQASHVRLSETLEEARAMAHALNLEMQARQRAEVMMEDIAKNREGSFGQCKCQEGFQVNDRKAAAPSLYISQVSLTLTDLSDACVQTDNCHPHQTSVLTQTDFIKGDETRHQFDACVQVSNDVNSVDACVQTVVSLSQPSLDHPTRPPDVTSLRHQTDSWTQTDSWDSQGHGETDDTVCACTQTFYGCSDASTQTDGQSRHSVSTVHSYVSALVANAVAEIGAEAQSCYNLNAQGQQLSEGHCSQQDIEECQNQGECREKQTSKQDEKQETCLDLSVNQQDQIHEEIYCKQNVPELSQGQGILQDKGQDKTPCCSETEVGTVSEKNCEDKVFECHSVDQEKLVNDSIEAKVLPPKTQLTSDTLEEAMDHVLTPNVPTVTQVTVNCSDVPVSQTHNTGDTLDYTEDGSYNISSNSVATSESSLGQVATPDTENSKARQEKDSERMQDTPAAKSQGKMSYLYDPVLDIYYRPSEGVQPDENVPDANPGNVHTKTTSSSDTCSLAPRPLGTGSAGPSLSGFIAGSQGFRPPDSSSLISKLPEANSYRLGFSPPDSRPLDTKTSSLESRPAEGNPGSLGCRTSLQERLGLMSKIRMANSFSIQEEEAEDGCEEDT
ncbi:uncharacterized protein LOC144917886 [Branchiostoma floridae x Branchiostoma belcheri]